MMGYYLTMATPTHMACVWDFETDEPGWFLKGTKEECEKAAKALAEEMEIEFLDSPPDDAEGDYAIVLPVSKETASFLVKVKATSHNAYGNQHIGFGYTHEASLPKSERVVFVPVNPSKFNVGDTVIMAGFRASAPGGWVVLSPDLKTREYWQENTIER